MRFVVLGDSKGKVHGVNESVLTKILKQTCRLNPNSEFIVMCGDSVAGNEDENILKAQLQGFKDLVDKYYSGKLVLPVIGNHEVNNEPTDDRYEKIFKEVYCNLHAHGYLQGYNQTVYYIDLEDTRLIVLNAFHYGSIHRIDNIQMKWFEEIASINKKNKIVFIHSPAFPTGAHLGHCLDLYPDDRDSFWSIVDKCGIDIVFSGHEHNYSRRVIDSSFDDVNTNCNKKVYQIITGGGGEKLRDKYKSKKGIVVAPIAKYHFVVVDLKDDGIEVCAITIEGKKLDKFKIEK